MLVKLFDPRRPCNRKANLYLNLQPNAWNAKLIPFLSVKNVDVLLE